MNLNWQNLGHVASGGTIMDISQGSDGNLWAATPTGLFRKQANRWLPVSRGMSLTQVTAILAVRKTLITAGWPDGILYSTNNGATWHKAWIDQIETPINCLEISPNFATDRVLLAGTQGRGILRTTDGGRHWCLSNFGLRNFSVYALAAVGLHQSYRDFSYLKEIVYAATDDGVYQSPNGGRAWRPAGNETSGQTILAIALSNDFSNNKTIFAGTESGILFNSTNGGQTWEKLNFGQISPGAINCLLPAVNGDLFVGTSQVGLLRLIDRGKTWESILSGIPSVLMLKQIKSQLFVGISDSGLLVSPISEVSWKNETELVTRRFHWLVSTTENELVAAGPEEGIWISTDQGKSWKVSPNWPEERLLLGISADEDVIVAASPEGIWHSLDFGKSWVLSLETQLDLTPFYLIQTDQFVWGVSNHGPLWFSKNQGQNWTPIEMDFSGNPVIGLAISPHFSTNKTLFVGTRDLSQQQVQLWRSTDWGESWALWQSMQSAGGSLQMVIHGNMGNDPLLGLGTQVIEQGTHGWNVDTITSDEALITAVAVIPESDLQIVALADQVLYRSVDTEWQPLSSTIQGESIVDFCQVTKNKSDHTLFALTRDGMVWRCEI